MNKYIEYILSQIVVDVNYLEVIFNSYKWGTWIFMSLFWVWWIIIKFALLTSPIWAIFNLTIGRLSIVRNITNVTNHQNGVQ